MPGKGDLTLTGLLGESMKESAQAAMSYLRSHAKDLDLDATRFARTDVHIHVPAGAVPKDGPSAGVAISAALISLFRDEPVRGDLAMTGEVTLTGRVLPVGGVREKVLAARRAGIKAILVPRHNLKDLIELPEEVKADVEFDPVDTLGDVMAHLFRPASETRAAKPPPASSRGKPKAPRKRPATPPARGSEKPGRLPRTGLR